MCGAFRREVIKAHGKVVHIYVLKNSLLLRHHILSKLIYNFNATPIEISTSLYVYLCDLKGHPEIYMGE